VDPVRSLTRKVTGAMILTVVVVLAIFWFMAKNHH
jgi:hypothetical protein